MTRDIECVAVPGGPRAIGAYSPAITLGAVVFCSGHLPLDSSTGEVVPGGVAAQTERSLTTLGATLIAAGSGLDRIVKTTVFLVSVGDFAVMNETYTRIFGGHRPARSTIGVRACHEAHSSSSKYRHPARCARRGQYGRSRHGGRNGR